MFDPDRMIYDSTPITYRDLFMHKPMYKYLYIKHERGKWEPIYLRDRPNILFKRLSSRKIRLCRYVKTSSCISSRVCSVVELRKGYYGAAVMSRDGRIWDTVNGIRPYVSDFKVHESYIKNENAGVYLLKEKRC